jgi:hypothetical protein
MSVAQIEFAASQNRQEVKKLDGNAADVSAEIRLCPALNENPLMNRLIIFVTLILVFYLSLFARGGHEVNHAAVSTQRSGVERPENRENLEEVLAVQGSMADRG